jgi:pimeloyl-ACP methyl ester carboxylesterase
MTAVPVTIATDDGIDLRGQLWPGADDWVVLVHDVGDDEDLDRWRPLVPYLLGADLAVLAVDLRGHGASDGEWTNAAAVADTAAVVRFARERGAGCVTIVGAGVSGVNALFAVEAETAEGVVALSPRGSDALSARNVGISVPSTAPLPRAPGVPKLLVVGSRDPASRDTTDRLRAASIGWALVVSLPTADRGTALLDGPWAGHVREQLLAFVREQRFIARGAGERRRESGDIVAKGDGR